MEIKLKEYNELDGFIDSVYHEAAKKLHMTDTEMIIFYVICARGNGCNQKLLYQETGVSKTTINTCLRKLVRENILYLEPGKGRNTRVFLTKKGNEWLRRVEKLVEIENRIFMSWSVSDREKFIELSKRYGKQLKEEVDQLEI